MANSPEDRDASGLKIAFFAVLGAALFLGLMWIGQGNNFFLFKVFAPKYEQVRRDTFTKSQAYNDGMNQRLEQLLLDYQDADAGHKAALASIVLHDTAGFDIYDSRVSSQVRAFVEQLRGQRAAR